MKTLPKSDMYSCLCRYRNSIWIKIPPHTHTRKRNLGLLQNICCLAIEEQAEIGPIETASVSLRGIPNPPATNSRSKSLQQDLHSPWLEHNGSPHSLVEGYLEAILMTQLVTHLSSKEPASKGSGRISTEKGLNPGSLPPLLSQELHSCVNHSKGQRRHPEKS